MPTGPLVREPLPAFRDDQSPTRDQAALYTTRLWDVVLESRVSPRCTQARSTHTRRHVGKRRGSGDCARVVDRRWWAGTGWVWVDPRRDVRYDSCSYQPACVTWQVRDFRFLPTVHHRRTVLRERGPTLPEREWRPVSGGLPGTCPGQCPAHGHGPRARLPQWCPIVPAHPGSGSTHSCLLRPTR